jgi:type II secretory pathway component HofQ
MGAVKNFYHDEICAAADAEEGDFLDFERQVQEIKVSTAISLVDNINAVSAGINGLRCVTNNKRILLYMHHMADRLECMKRQASVILEGM